MAVELVHHPVAVIDQGRHAGMRVELEVVRAVLLAGLGVDLDQFERRADILQHGVRRHGGAARREIRVCTCGSP